MFFGGRLFGTLVGFFIFNVPGAIVGFALGFVFDKSVSKVLAENLTVQGEAGQARVKQVFLQVLFTALGQIAKADGRVSPEEIAHTENIIKDFALDAEGRQQAIDWFQQGVNNQGHYQELLQEFNVLSRTRPELKQVMLEVLISLAMADGQLDSQEESILLDIAAGLGINKAAFQHILRAIKGQAGFQNSQPNSVGQLDEAYKALGVNATDSDKEIKTAYRRLMSRHHPDKLIAQGVPEDAVRLATQKSQAIQSAYEVIKKSRK